MQPLKEGNRALTSQKDALLAEKTALKNEVSTAAQRVRASCVCPYRVAGASYEEPVICLVKLGSLRKTIIRSG